MNRVTIGLCTVSTRTENYLLDTLSSLLDNLSIEAQQEVQIVLFDCDATAEESASILETRTQFGTEIERGLIEIIRTNPSDYPDLTNLPSTLSDSPERIYWRTKQCLDYSLIFQYCAGKGAYYLHLEDDVICAENFYAKMWTDIQRFPDADWSALQFCELGFIGMLFKDGDLNKIASFMQTFCDEMPVDWLISYFFELRRRQGQEFIQVERSLFQHIGYHSSLDGKTSTFRSKLFDRFSLHDQLGQYRGASAISQVLSRGFLTYRKARSSVKRVLKPNDGIKDA
ncbi:MAG: hypothetical protein AAF639_01260 [Chloroflexota bacterium]